MQKENKTQLRAKEVFQRLELTQQKWVKEKEPEVYKEIFGDGALVNETVLNDFIERYQKNSDEDLRSYAVDVFSRLPHEKQSSIKHFKPEIYNALFVEKSTNEKILKQFLDDYEPLNQKIKTIIDFNNLSLEEQINFKAAYPDDYNRIMSTEPKEN